MRKLVIEVKKWLHGSKDTDDGEESRLLRVSDEKMCCLGIYLEACGVPRSKLSDVGKPADVEARLPKEARWLTAEDAGEKDANLLMKINDGQVRGGKVDRRRIKKIFAKHDVEVVFK